MSGFPNLQPIISPQLIVDDVSSVQIATAYRTPGVVTALAVDGVIGAPALLQLEAPNGTDYADYTYDGNNGDIDVSKGNLNLRPLDGSPVSVWSPTHNTPLAVNSSGGTHNVGLQHDGTNGHITTDTGDLDITPGSALINLTNVNFYASASAGANGTLPLQVQGYLGIKVQGTSVKVPYYAP
jgi:hypothetical protein